MNENNKYNAIIDYLTNSLDNESKDSIDQWINSNKENKITFNTIKSIWEEESQNSTTHSDWKNIESRINNNAVGNKREVITWLAVACTFLLILSGLWFSKALSSNKVILQTNDNCYLVDTLQNNWIVYLYPNSKLIYKPNRENKIKFLGQGYFVIPESQSHPVNITLGNANIHAFSSSFKVNSCNIKEELKVSVESGNLMLMRDNNPNSGLTLHAGEQGYHSCREHTLWKGLNDEDIYLIYQPEIVDL